MGKMKELGLLDCEDRQSIEENFERIKKSGSGGGGLPSDLVETVPDEVPLEITWDGDVTGKEMVDNGGGNAYLVKVSDMILTKEQLLNAVFYDPYDEIEDTLTEESFIDMSEMGVPIMMCGSYIMVAKSSFDMGDGVAHPAGLYFYYVISDGSFVSYLRNPNVLIPGGERTQIKPEFMPPHKHKWDDIEDQPFYDKSVSAPLNITYDGDMTGKEVVQQGDGEYLVKISDAVLTYDQIIGTTCFANNIETGEEQTIVLTAEDLMDLNEQGMPIIIAPNIGVYFVRENVSANGLNLTAGIWAMDISNEEGRVFAKSLSNPNVTITTSEIKKLDPKFYDRPCYDDIIEIPFDFVFNSNNEIVANSGMHLAKVSNVIITEESDLVGSQIYASDGRVINITSSDISKDDNVINVSFFAMCVIDDFEMATDCILTPGVWVVVTGAVTGDGVYVTRFAKPGEVLTERKLTPLPEKFMPNLNQLTMISPSGKKFKVTVDDSGKLTAVEV